MSLLTSKSRCLRDERVYVCVWHVIELNDIFLRDEYKLEPEPEPETKAII